MNQEASFSYVDSSLAPRDRFQDSLKPILDARKILDGGIGRYTQNLIQGLLEYDVPLTLLGDPYVLSDFDWYKDVNIEVENAPGYSLEELFLLGRRHDFTKYSVFHTPHFVLPYSISIPSIITVHDLIHIYHPEKWFYPYIAAPLVRSCLKRASHVVTVSDSSKKDIIHFMGRAESSSKKITTITNSIQSCDYKYASDVLSEENPLKSSGQNKVQGFDTTTPYFLTIFSNAKPHKGINQLLEAFRLLKKKCQESKISLPKLVLAGSGMEELFKSDSSLHSITQAQDVLVLGKVSADQLSLLYKNAHLLIVPSRAEGFCLPVIESQVHGTRVLACPVPAVKEILSDNDIVTDSFEPQEIFMSLFNYLQFHSDFHEKKILEEHMSRFEPMRTTLDMIDVYKNHSKG